MLLNITEDRVLAKVQTHDDSTSVLHRYSIGEDFSGFAFRSSSRSLAKSLEQHPMVLLVEPDGYASGQELCVKQKNAEWNLNRISNHMPVVNGNDYTYDRDGTGVDIYVIDSGVRVTHIEFRTPTGGSRAIWAQNFIDADNSDCVGHGTHVAGILAGNTYGVAKNASVISVKVLDCSNRGPWSVIIAGMNWATQQFTQRKRPAVVNMSIVGKQFASVNAAATAMVAAGLPLFVCAGNDFEDACGYSPASASAASCL